MAEVIVIGAGAAGMVAAVGAARAGAGVILLEGKEKPAKKLLMTGNGKCNLTNVSGGMPEMYRGTHPEFVLPALKDFGPQETISFFESMGLLTREKRGYIYPYSEQAAAVADILAAELKRLKVKVKCSQKVTGLEYSRDKKMWLVHTDGWTYEGKSAVLCAGSKAAPATGSDGSGYALAASCGHTVIKPLPALVPLKVKESFVKNLSGIRSTVRLSFCAEGYPVMTEEGELQWTDYGISGIVVFQLSRFAAEALEHGKEVHIFADLMPEYGREQVMEILKKTSSLEGVFPKKMIPVLLKEAQVTSGGTPGIPGGWSDEETARLCSKIKNLSLTVTGTKSYEAAQVCLGGVDTEEVDAATMESLMCPGLYFAGEILDVDGACGGFNLQWAWASGLRAGRAAAEKGVIK